MDNYLQKLQSTEIIIKDVKYVFGYDDMAGSIYLESDENIIYCTPFWEDTKGIPVEVSTKEFEQLCFYVIPFPEPNGAIEIKKFFDYFPTLLKEKLTLIR